MLNLHNSLLYKLLVLYFFYKYSNEAIAMKKKFLSIFVCVCIISSIFCAMSVNAFAASDYFSVKVKSGDTITSICKNNKIDFEDNKHLIMVLNDMSKEAELDKLSVGDTIKLPTKSAMTGKGSISGDKVKYYVIPYVIESGDYISNIYWLWGLKYENYLEDIKALNYTDDLDILWVGSTYLLPTTEANVKTGNYTTVMTHTLKSGETAYDVFSSYGIDYEDNQKKLERYNLGRDLTKLSTGDELLIPIF